MRSLRRAMLVAALLTLPVFMLEMGSHLVPGVHNWVMNTIGHRESWYFQFALTKLVLFGPGLRFFQKGVPALKGGDAFDVLLMHADGTSEVFTSYPKG